MPADGPPPSGRIDLADPGHRPSGRPPIRWRTWLTIGLLVAAVAAGGFFGRGLLVAGIGAAGDGVSAAWGAVDGWASSLRDRAADEASTTTTTTLPPPEPPVSYSMLVVVGEGPGGAAFGLVHRSPDGDRELLMLPQALLLQVPGFGEFTLVEALVFGGPELVRMAVANETGLRLDELVVIPTGGLEALGDGFVVDVPVELFVQGSDGSRRLIAPGPQRVSIELAELLLGEQGEGDLFEWLRRQEAVWVGALDVIAAEPEAASRLVVGSSAAASLLVELAAEPLVGAPPVDRVAIGASDTAFVLATDRIESYLAGELGHLLIVEGRRDRVEILNGNGVAGSTVPAAGVLIADGFYVFRTGNADRFDYEASSVIAQGADAAAAAQRAADLLGITDVVLEARAPSGVVDLSIIVGSDLASTED